MTATIEDLTPFFDDRCWMFILLARQASVGVVIRRGPTEWWRVTRWDTLRDRFEGGQWFRGRMYPEKCDLSPDGKLFLRAQLWGEASSGSPARPATSGGALYVDER
jgi:hypothetical protein